jgi:hypothetical protein
MRRGRLATNRDVGGPTLPRLAGAHLDLISQ